MPYTNRYVKFIKRPVSRPTADVFEMDEEDISELKSGEFLIKNVYLALDPAMVGRMREESNYADSVDVGGVMHCYGVGQVIESKNPNVSKGELRMGQLNMQEYNLSSNPEDFSKINVGLADPTWYLSVTGTTGMTAYFALRDICQPKSGETIVISAGASSVGMIAAQLAKKAGCRVVGIVSTDEKAEVLRRGGIYDDAISYRGKEVDTLTADLSLACPSGVDMYFDNTSGDISEALLDIYNDNSRIAVIGRLGISHLPDTRKDVGRRDNNVILAKRISKKGMVLLDYKSQYPEAVIQLSGMVHRKEIRFDEDIMHGIDQMPEAFFRVLDGKNNGKQLVKVGDINRYSDPSPVKIGQSIRSKKWLNGFVVNALKSGRTVKSLLPARA